MEALFLRILNMSLAASLLGGVVVFLRCFAKKHLPRWVFYVLWLGVLARLLVPVFPTSPLSPFSSLPSGGVESFGAHTAAITLVENTAAPFPFPALDWGPAPRVLLAPTPPVFVLGHVWLWGLVLLALYGLLSWLSLSCRLAHGTVPVSLSQLPQGVAALLPRRVSVLRGELFSTPVVCGFLRPRLLLPQDFFSAPSPHRSMMLFHEALHLRRRDGFSKLLWTLALCLHWFNPLVWLFYKLFITDMESSCDQSALAHSAANPADYAALLLSMASGGRSAFAGGLLSFGESCIGERIRSILTHRRAGTVTWILSIAVALGLTAAFLLNPPPISAPPLSPGSSLWVRPGPGAVPPPASSPWESSFPFSVPPSVPSSAPAPSSVSSIPSPPPAPSSASVPVVLPPPATPSPLAVDRTAVSTLSLFSPQGTFVLVTGERDITAILAAVNAAAFREALPIPQADQAPLRLQLRFTSGEKQEYYLGPEVLTWGKEARRCDAALFSKAEALLAHSPQGAAWLGHMNPYRILGVESGGRTLTGNSPCNRAAILAISAALQGLWVEPESFSFITQTPAVGSSALTLRLVFDSDVTYTVTLEDDLLWVEASDMAAVCQYRLADAAPVATLTKLLLAIPD